jgi:hypothetical protein
MGSALVGRHGARQFSALPRELAVLLRFAPGHRPTPRLGVRVPFRSSRQWPEAHRGLTETGISAGQPIANESDKAALVFPLHLRVKLAGQSIEICHRRASLLGLLKLVCRTQPQVRRVGVIFGGLGPGEKRSRSFPIITLARHSARHFPDCALADRTLRSGIGSLRYLSKNQIWRGASLGRVYRHLRGMLRCLRRTRTCNRGARDRGTGSGNRGGLVFVA